MNTYDPNIVWAKHTVEIDYQQWDYKGTFTVQIGGNCRGLSILTDAISSHADKLADEHEYPMLILKRPAENGDGEDTLECDADETELERMCVAIRIVKHEATAA